MVLTVRKLRCVGGVVRVVLWLAAGKCSEKKRLVSRSVGHVVAYNPVDIMQ